MMLIDQIVALLFPSRPDEALVRKTHTDDIAALVSPTLVTTCTPCATALLPFRNPLVRALVHEVKYRDNNRAVVLLNNVLHDYLNELNAEEGLGRVCVIPIPISKKRKRERGYNQVENIMRAGKSEMPAPYRMDILKRLCHTPSQTTLSGVMRKDSMRGAFGASPNLDSSYTYLILDDVITTGATMQAAIVALQKSGAKNIIPLALAH